LKRTFLYWFPVFLWLTVIALESFLLSSHVTGSFLWRMFQFLHVPMSAETFARFHHLLRKAGHVTGYGILTLLLFRAWYHKFQDSRSRTSAQKYQSIPSHLRLRCAGLAVGITLLTAVLDEWHQSFDPSRTSSVRDVGLDLTGAVLFLSIALFVFRIWQAPTEKLQTLSA
jgi:VanZ family protein